MTTEPKTQRKPLSETGLVTMLVLLGLLCATESLAQFSNKDEYVINGYHEPAVANPIARLEQAMQTGGVTLPYQDNGRGKLDALLAVLNIDPASQLLVYSPTSLQHKLISPEKPRALFFNNNTYIGFVQNSEIVEVTSIDDDKGMVFYTFDNVREGSKGFERSDQTCLVCHDTQGTMGGGVPMLMALSSVYSKRNVPLKNYSGIGNIVDQSPLAGRWGGWYVTGRHGLQPHLGNIFLDDASQLENLDDFRIWNLKTLRDTGYMDPEPYPADTSDIVALMVLEHQVTIQNQITYVKFKAPAVLKRRGIASVEDIDTWAALPKEAQRALQRMLDNLVALLVFMDAADLQSRISGTPAYTEAFLSRGVMDSQGRSLRELDLGKRLFCYPLSYLVYTDDFNSLQPYALDYVLQQLAAYLSGDITLPGRSQFTDAERQAALEILTETLPAFRPYMTARTTAATGNMASAW